MRERKAGWYWVQVDEQGDPWEAAHWSGKEWSLMGTDLRTHDVATVGRHIPMPENPSEEKAK